MTSVRTASTKPMNMTAKPMITSALLWVAKPAPSLSAALYFVALEALANTQKHAPGAAATVSLRSAQDGRSVVLEVHDDGPGFERRLASPGTGLQNMHDRVAAVGGELEIDSRPGAGTWIRAETPVAAPVIALQPDADSLR